MRVILMKQLLKSLKYVTPLEKMSYPINLEIH